MEIFIHHFAKEHWHFVFIALLVFPLFGLHVQNENIVSTFNSRAIKVNLYCYKSLYSLIASNIVLANFLQKV